MKEFLRLQVIGTASFKNAILGIIISISFLNSKPVLSQTTNAGTDFWFGFTNMYDSTAATFEVYISSPVNATGTVSVPGQGFSQNFNVTPGTIAQVVLPSASVEVMTSEVIENKAVHVTSDNNVVVYAHTYHQFRADASLILPVPALGNEYYVASYNPSGTYPSEFLVIGSDSTTTVEITPSANTDGGRVANVPFNVTLDSGEVYQVSSRAGDLTGSKVQSLNVADKFSVIGGSKFPAIPFNGNGTKDPIYDQLFPVSAWGKNYIFVPTPLLNDDICRVIASQNGTSVSINGAPVATLNAGQFYEQSISAASFISGNQPICVARYLKCASCVAKPVPSPSNAGLDMGDPSMVIIDANEQMYLDTITFYTTSNYKIDTSYVQIVTRTGDVNTIFLDAVNVGSKFTTLASNPLYSFMNTSVDTGAHTLRSNGCGFLAYITGLGGAESYAYAAGVALQNFTTVIPDSGCVGSDVQFSATSIGSSVSWNWNFGDGDTSTLQNPTHAYTDSGTYTISVLFTLNGGCTDTITKPIIVSSCVSVIPPTGGFNASDTVICANDCISFKDKSTNATSWLWSFPGGTPSSSTDENPALVCYITDGIYDVTLVASNSSGIDTVTLSNYITVYPQPPVPDLSLTGSTIFFQTDSSYTSYQWFDSTTAIAGATDTFLVITHSGNYNVQVSNKAGCKVAVGINIILDLSENSRNTFISLSPNPTYSKLAVHANFPDYADITISIMDIFGEIALQEKVKWHDEEIINVNNLAAGIYFVRVECEKGLYLKRFVKE